MSKATIKNISPKELKNILEEIKRYTKENKTKVFFNWDTETTGVQAEDSIISVGGVFTKLNEEIINSFEFFLNPFEKNIELYNKYKDSVPQYLTLITKEFLEGKSPLIGTDNYIDTIALSFENYSETLEEIITSNEIIPIAHNSKFDEEMLHLEFARLGKIKKSYKEKYLDSKEILLKIYKEEPKIKKEVEKKIKKIESSIDLNRFIFETNNIENQLIEDIKEFINKRNNFSSSETEKRNAWDKIKDKLNETQKLEIIKLSEKITSGTLNAAVIATSIIDNEYKQRNREINGVEAHGAEIDSLLLADFIKATISKGYAKEIFEEAINNNQIEEIKEVKNAYFQTDTSMLQNIQGTSKEKKEIIQLSSLSINKIFDIAQEQNLSQIIIVNTNTLDYSRIQKESNKNQIKVVFGCSILIEPSRKEIVFLPKTKKASLYIQKYLMKETMNEEELNKILNNIPKDILEEIEIDKAPIIIKTVENEVDLLIEHNKNPFGENFKNQRGLYTSNTKIIEKSKEELYSGYPERVERMPEYKETNEEEFKKNIRSLATTEEELERINTELRVLENTGFIKYFEIQKDFIDFTKTPITKDGESFVQVGPGRGSGAGSLIAYKIGITNVPPLELGLFFERFLNEERVNAPDFDIDYHGIIEIEEIANQGLKDELIKKFGKNTKRVNGRDIMLAYTRLKYGSENVLNIATIGRYGLKSSIDKAKDFYEAAIKSTFPNNTPAEITAKIKEFLPEKKDEFGNVIPDEPEDFDFLMEEIKSSDIYIKNPNLFDKLIKTAKEDIFGKTKNTGLHASGICINNLTEENQPKGSVMKIGNALAIAEEGPETDLIKFDFLGLLTLSTIALTEKKLTKEEINKFKEFKTQIPSLTKESSIGLKIYEEIAKDSSNMFQIESKGMQKLNKRIKPKTFEDIMAILALFRPGPIGSGVLEEYVKRASGEKEITYRAPQLKEILSGTYGVPVFQEQVMQTFQKLANFSLGEADLIRRGMSKPGYDLSEYKEKTISNMLKNGIEKENAEAIWEELKSFSGYTFNKSHTAAYGFLTLQTAYLKIYHPFEYYSALLEAKIFDGIKQEELEELITTIEKTGIKLICDINKSHLYKAIADKDRKQIFLPLTSIKGIKENKNSQGDKIFIEKMNNGDFKSLEDLKNRIDLSEKMIETLKSAGVLNSILPKEERINEKINVLNEQGNIEIIQNQKNTLNEVINNNRSFNNQIVAITKVKQVKTKKGQEMAFITIADGEQEITSPIFSKTWLELKTKIKENELMKIKGYIKDNSIMIQNVFPIEKKEIRNNPLPEEKKNEENSLENKINNFENLNEQNLIISKINIVKTKQGKDMVFLEFKEGDYIAKAIIFPQQFQKLKEELNQLNVGEEVSINGKVQEKDKKIIISSIEKKAIKQNEQIKKETLVEEKLNNGNIILSGNFTKPFVEYILKQTNQKTISYQNGILELKLKDEINQNIQETNKIYNALKEKYQIEKKEVTKKPLKKENTYDIYKIAMEKNIKLYATEGTTKFSTINTLIVQETVPKSIAKNINEGKEKVAKEYFDFFLKQDKNNQYQNALLILNEIDNNQLSEEQINNFISFLENTEIELLIFPKLETQSKLKNIFNLKTGLNKIKIGGKTKQIFIPEQGKFNIIEQLNNSFVEEPKTISKIVETKKTAIY